SRSVSSHVAQHLAMSPTLEDVTIVAQEAGREMARLHWIEPQVDLFDFEPNLFVRGIAAFHSALGGSPQTFFTRLHGAVEARYRALWLGHMDKLDGELLERAPVVYTRLALRELLGRIDVRDAKLSQAIEEL